MPGPAGHGEGAGPGARSLRFVLGQAPEARALSEGTLCTCLAEKVGRRGQQRPQEAARVPTAPPGAPTGRPGLPSRCTRVCPGRRPGRRAPRSAGAPGRVTGPAAVLTSFPHGGPRLASRLPESASRQSPPGGRKATSPISPRVRAGQSCGSTWSMAVGMSRRVASGTEPLMPWRPGPHVRTLSFGTASQVS